MNTEGIWYVKKIRNGWHKRKVCDLTKGVSEGMKHTRFEKLRQGLTRDIDTYMNNCKYTPKTKDIVEIIYQYVKEDK